ncbi:MAG TPA: tRNA pseudouridine(38-40) synthase TruA [Gemmatimonadaceae bacterium]|nr:tRNA pseudouridine(38-40) synthase TruA [Gemmatimonadaceae bacterium]
MSTPRSTICRPETRSVKQVCRPATLTVICAMESRTLQLVLQYDGTRFAGWQRQPDERTVQGVVEAALEKLCQRHVAVLGAGRTDAGVHALGQSAGIRVPERWTATDMRRALNAVLPEDVWISAAYPMTLDFHARFSALSRAYRYLVGTDEEAESPFRRNRELAWRRPLDRQLLDQGAQLILGDNCFRGFAVKGTAPESDNHRCNIFEAKWLDRDGGVAFFVRANRFLHHMVRFLVGTMLDVASGRRAISDISELLEAPDNRAVSPPVPSHGLYLEKVEYPHELYLVDA